MEAFQAEVAWTALAAIGGQGFALAGAGALIAHGLVDRLTEDLYLPKNVRAAWERQHPELARLGAGPHVPST